MIKFTTEGIYCIPGKFYLDPWLPVDYAVITHGHSDHARPGMKNYLCHHQTMPVIKSRLGADINVQSLGYNEEITINNVKLSFHPAGHIIGSAQVRLEYEGKVVVFSGDYKVQDDGLSTPFEPVRCHEFITESTFGLPIYNWFSVAQQKEQLQQWVIANKAKHKTSVFIGYSLGKAQRIMKALEGVAPIHVHYSISKLNAAYESAGVHLPDSTTIDLREDIKHVSESIIILPPSLLDSKVIKKIPALATAICSGWMQVRGARRWRSADAGFAISDHADWNGLLTAIKATGAEKVYVTHGQTNVFTKYLNETGIAAEEVKTQFNSEEEDIEQSSSANPVNEEEQNTALNTEKE